MDDRLDAVIATGPRDQRCVGDVSDHERGAQHGVGRAQLERVEHDDLAAGISEGSHGVRADVPGAAGDQDRHDSIFHSGLRVTRPVVSSDVPRSTSNFTAPCRWS